MILVKCQQVIPDPQASDFIVYPFIYDQITFTWLVKMDLEKKCYISI